MTSPSHRPSRRTFLQLVAASSAAAGIGSTGAAIAQEAEGEAADVPVAGDFPAGQTVGLQRVAEGLPAPTSLEYVEVDGEVHHFVTTQTGQILTTSPDGDGSVGEGTPAEDADDEETPDEDVDGEAEADEATPDDEAAVTEFVFDGVTSGWNGRDPAEVEGAENPTLELEAGETYRITWVNADGQPHNVVVLDADDNVLERTEIVSEAGEEQTLEFQATEEMYRYICEVHPGTMSGRLEVEETPEVPEGMDLFLDISDRLVGLGIGELGNYDERGLLSMAFHPDFADNRTFYVRYSAPERHGLGYDHTDVLAEFQADEDLTGADPTTERTIMEVPQPQDNHNGGQLAFGPEGYLYTSVGDGGNVHDIGLGHVEDWYEENRGGNAQDTSENLLGGILRIDVDPESDEEAEGPLDGAYEVPEDNPLVDAEEYLDEYYAWGFRNPWGMSIDDDGTVFVSDAGQHRIESAYVVEGGGNYGWNVKEGSFCFSPDNPLSPPEDCPDVVDEDLPDPRGGEQLRDPIAEYRHSRISEAFIDSSVVVGGHRYEGEELPDLAGTFVFGNWSSQGVARADGEVLVATPPEDDSATGEDADAATGDDQTEGEDETAGDGDLANGDGNVTNGAGNVTDSDSNGTVGDGNVTDDEGGGNGTGEVAGGNGGAGDDQWDLAELQFEGADDESLNRYVYGIERDESGELYVLANTDYRPFPPTGEIYRIVPAEEGEDVPAPEETGTIDAPTEEEPGEDDETEEATVRVEDHPDHGEVLVGPDGMTLYMFDQDEQGADESACEDDCAESWPPLTVSDEPTAGEDVTADLEAFERADGDRQVTADGWPLYYFAPDEEPGDATGQGVNDVWWVLAPDGTPIRADDED